MIKQILIIFLLIGLSSAYVLPTGTFVNGTLNVNGTSGFNATTASTGWFSSDLRVGGGSYLNATSVDTLVATGVAYMTQISASGGIWGDDLNATNDTVLNRLYTYGAASLNGTDINGAATTRDITLDAGSDLTLSGTGTATAPTFVGNVKVPDFFSIGVGRIVDDNWTYTAGSKMDSIVQVDCRSYNSTITLLPAAQAPGNVTIIKLQYLPGSYYTRINVSGGGHINGYDILKTTDDAGTFLPSVTLWSSSAAWYVIDALGTWTSTDA
jgi:hypothetical protein